MEVETQQQATEVHTFYAWIEGLPADETVHISGGERITDGNGMIKASQNIEARFTMGIFHTDDSHVIAALRKLIQKGANYTEDKELYLSHILNDKQKLDRNQTISQRTITENNALKTQLAEAARKNKELEAELAGKGKGKPTA